LTDVLKFDVDSVIKAVTVPEILGMLKEQVPILEAIGDEDRMHAYQSAYMDERDLALHEYRDDQSASRRSLTEFLEQSDDPAKVK